MMLGKILQTSRRRLIEVPFRLPSVQNQALASSFPAHLFPPPPPRRRFQTSAEYREWQTKVIESRLQVPTNALQSLNLEQEAPFLFSVSPMADRLELYGISNAPLASPHESMLECRYPLEKDKLLRNSVTDFNNWSSFRLGKFYETVDALTADVAYRHCNGGTPLDQAAEHRVTLVTAGHYHSRKLARTNIHTDLFLRSYVTSVGRSSMEVRTDAVDLCPDGSERLVNVCHTVMVALDPATMKPLSKSGRSIRPLELTDDTRDAERLQLAQQHQEIRQARSRQAMQLRLPVSAPPTPEEMRRVHQLQQGLILQSEEPNSNKPPPPVVADFTFRSSCVVFPEQRNVHGKLFGGFVMTEAQNLAQYTATFFAQGNPVISLGIDDAIFLQPIGIGDLVTFTARLVHSTGSACRVLVTVEVRDAKDRNRRPMRSNRLMFVFGGANFPDRIVPSQYGEILMHIDAHRRHQVEGPFEEDVQRIVQEAQQKDFQC